MNRLSKLRMKPLREIAKILSIFIILAAVRIGIYMFTPKSDTPPPGWEERHLTFDSDQDMADHCDCLSFDTTGLSVENANRSLDFEPNGSNDRGKWERLDAAYSISDGNDLAPSHWNQFSMTVYFEELQTTDGFPVRGLEIQNCIVNNIPIQYQRLSDKEYTFRALFLYDGDTYEVTASSPDHAAILWEYLQRLIPTGRQAAENA